MREKIKINQLFEEKGIRVEKNNSFWLKGKG